MESKPYPIEKRRILLQHDTNDFLTFLNEVKTPEGKHFIRQELLPNQVPGFRQGRVPLAQIVPRLINNLMKENEVTNTNSVIWEKFNRAWIAWVESHHRLNVILLEFDNGKDFNDTHNCIAPPNSELDIRCFKILMEASLDNQIDQETIRRFYEFGYFLPSDQIETLIEESRPRADIELQRRIAELPHLVDKLSETIDSLSSRVSDIESSDERTQEFNQRITEVNDSFEAQLSEIQANFNKSVGQLKRAINSRLSKVEDSVKSVKTHVSDAEFLNSIEQEIGQLIQCIQESNQSHGDRFDGLDKRIAEIKTERDKQSQLTKAPRLAYQAVCIGDRFDSQLSEDNEHYSDEDDYLWNFTHCLRRFGVTNSGETGDEMAAAIHVALKTFPALAFNDTRVFRVWQLMCGNHCHVTEISVEMGWLGFQDWFPELFSQECFGEQLRRIDLEISIRRMLEVGDMPWAIHFSNCDRSFPESYLPRFLDWIGKLSDGEIRIFLTSCSGMNRCRTTQDAYARVACLPAPAKPEPIEARNLQPGDIVTRQEWKSWCQPNHAVHQVEFLNQLQGAIENTGVQIPIVLLREIQRYLGLSHGLLAPSRALDWALTLRLLPWIAHRRELIDAMRDLMDQENRELRHFQKELLQAREESE